MPSSPLPPLSISILGVEPLDEFIKEVADYIHHLIVTNYRDGMPGNIEVEAKIGILREKGHGPRLSLPVLVETILTPGKDGVECQFESNMSSNQHRHYNNLLNNLKTTSAQPSHPAGPMDYSHLYLVDAFYSEDRNKVRVTRDEKTGTVIESIRKVRLGDLNIYSPKRSADWRVSVNLEIPVAHPIGSASHSRKKDRLSYTHQEFSIDLTQVTSTSAGQAPEVLHELEIEIRRSDHLVALALQRTDMSVSEEQRSAFDELIRVFVNNARILTRNAIDGWH